MSYQRSTECLLHGVILLVLWISGNRQRCTGLSGSPQPNTMIVSQQKRDSLHLCSLLMHFIVDRNGSGHCTHLFLLPLALLFSNSSLRGQQTNLFQCCRDNGMFPLLRVTRMSKTVPRTGVFILVGAIFFMGWNLLVFSAPIKLSMLAEVASLETLYKLVSLFPSTLCDLHFIFLYSIDYPDTYIISLFHYPTISNSISLSPSIHPSIHLPIYHLCCILNIPKPAKTM